MRPTRGAPGSKDEDQTRAPIVGPATILVVTDTNSAPRHLR